MKLIAIVSLITLGLFIKGLSTNAVIYICNDRKSIKAAHQDKKVSINLSDGRQFTLNQTLSASGIKFINKDGSVVFWSKGDGSFFQEGNDVTYSNCEEYK